MPPLEFHLLLSLADGPLYGYAIAEAVERESGGAISPRAGSLYRVIARLETAGLIDETDPPRDAAPHPGRERRYYTLTRAGRAALSAEAARLHQTAAIARRRLGLAEGRG
jgi:PadR family transcriptional regulator PadR